MIDPQDLFDSIAECVEAFRDAEWTPFGDAGRHYIVDMPDGRALVVTIEPHIEVG